MTTLPAWPSADCSMFNPVACRLDLAQTSVGIDVNYPQRRLLRAADSGDPRPARRVRDDATRVGAAGSHSGTPRPDSDRADGVDAPGRPRVSTWHAAAISRSRDLRVEVDRDHRRADCERARGQRRRCTPCPSPALAAADVATAPRLIPTTLLGAGAEDGGMSVPREVLPGQTYMITRRCTQRQFLMRPDKETNNAFIYCLAEAAARFGIEVLFTVAMSNHHHTGSTTRPGTTRVPRALPQAFREVPERAARALGELLVLRTDQRGPAGDPQDAIEKMVYALTNPVKDGLVESAHHWPGVSSLARTPPRSRLIGARPKHFFRDEGLMPETAVLAFARPRGFEQLTAADFAALVIARIRQFEEHAANQAAPRRHRHTRSPIGLAPGLEGPPKGPRASTRPQSSSGGPQQVEPHRGAAAKSRLPRRLSGRARSVRGWHARYALSGRHVLAPPLRARRVRSVPITILSRPTHGTSIPSRGPRSTSTRRPRLLAASSTRVQARSHRLRTSGRARNRAQPPNLRNQPWCGLL